ncbi:enoyl-CoA hydratase [Nocardioides campestrisoli]|uniref:enoyl-CoA hydratase n=1 Tax=Nocardioides campestrisoli TaxID=2736757 RepID=UPI00163D8A32|nr:enoyl-CoA hydratase [Nocardioides campestrisoli]
MTGMVLLQERIGQVALLRLNRPEVRNALNVELVTSLRATLAELAVDDEVRAVVLTGNGKAFCAGLDLVELETSGANLELAGGHDDGSPNQPWDPFPKPLVGAVNGPAVTGGLEVALACDFLVGSEAACFADTHSRVGVMPGWGLSVLLPQVVGRGVARRMSLTGDYMFAEEALGRGLLTEIVPADELVDTAVQVASTIAANDPAMVQAYLASYRATELASVGEGFAAETAASTAWLQNGFARNGSRRDAVISRGRSQTTAR